MEPLPLLGIQVVISFAAYGVFAWLVLVPKLDALPRTQSLVWTTWPESMRHIGATMLAPGITSPLLDEDYRRILAIGDLSTAALAIAATIALAKSWRYAIALTWVCHVFGIVDMVHNGIGAARLQAAPLLGVQWFVVAFGVPLMATFHILSFRTLLRRRVATVAS